MRQHIYTMGREGQRDLPSSWMGDKIPDMSRRGVDGEENGVFVQQNKGKAAFGNPLFQGPRQSVNRTEAALEYDDI